MKRINLQYRKTASGLPIISREEADILAEALVYDFSPECMKTPQPVDVDMFCESYLGLKQDFDFLSNCGLYLGMMVFRDTDKVIVYNPETDKAEYKFVSGNTVLIDNLTASTRFKHQAEAVKKNTLLSPRERQRKSDILLQKQKGIDHRYRFTMGHETAGHAVLHREYFENVTGKRDSIQCRAVTKKPKDRRQYTDSDWMEVQADMMASSFLMPASMVRKAVKEMEDLSNQMWEYYKYYVMVIRISEIFDVSLDAACIRLKNLGYIPKTYYQK